jgi:hypothetical protein
VKLPAYGGKRSLLQKSLRQKTKRTSKKFANHHYIEIVFLVHHYYDKKDFRCSDFTYGVKKDHNVENQNIDYLWRITYGYQGLWGVRLGSIRLG